MSEQINNVNTNNIPAINAVTNLPQIEKSTQQINIPEKIKHKINGKEVEVTIDDLKKSYGLDKTSWKRLEEAAKKSKEAEELKGIISQKDINSLLKAGWTEDEIESKAADFIIKRAKQKTMTPEQRAQSEREIEYERLKTEESDRKELEKNKIQNELEKREAKIYQTAFFDDIAKADKNTWLDLNDPIILTHVINTISNSLTKYNYDMPVSQALKILEEKFEKRGPPKKEYWKKLSKFGIKGIDDNDLDIFYEKGPKGIRENSVAAIKKAEAPFVSKQNTIPAKSKTDSLNPPIKYDSDYYKNEAKRYRDLRYNRLKPK